MLGDDIQVDGGALLKGMIAAHEERKGSVIATLEVEPDEISSYGCIDPIPIRDNLDLFMRDIAQQGEWTSWAAIANAIAAGVIVLQAFFAK